jgi:hypothetical protein
MDKDKDKSQYQTAQSLSSKPRLSHPDTQPPLAARSQCPSFHFQLRADTPVLHPGTNDRVPAMPGHVTSPLMRQSLQASKSAQTMKKTEEQLVEEGEGAKGSAYSCNYTNHHRAVLSYSQPSLIGFPVTVRRRHTLVRRRRHGHQYRFSFRDSKSESDSPGFSYYPITISLGRRRTIQ